MDEEVVLMSDQSKGITLIGCLILGAIGGACTWMVITLINADLWQPKLYVPIAIAVVCAFLIILLIRRAFMRVLTITPEGITQHRAFAKRFIPAGDMRAGLFTKKVYKHRHGGPEDTSRATMMVDMIYLGMPDGKVRGLFMSEANGPRISRVIQGLDHMLGIKVFRLEAVENTRGRKPDFSALKKRD